MRNCLIFSGSSCPGITSQICSNLGMSPAAVELTQFANGETSVKIMTSIREKDVFIVQSGSSKINDSIMELLIMISACKGASADRITAVLPYFPYGRQSKKKSHRGSIAARMLANLLHVAGVAHVITIDLHASQMQGFFKCPVDNLHAEPLIARWIRHNVPNWREAVCVSKNPGGTKRVTSLADALKLNFGIVTTEKRRGGNMSGSMILNAINSAGVEEPTEVPVEHVPVKAVAAEDEPNDGSPQRRPRPGSQRANGTSARASAMPTTPPRSSLARAAVDGAQTIYGQSEEDSEFTDERAREVIHGRLVQGHIVPDDYPSPTQSATSASTLQEHPEDDPMEMSMTSSFFADGHALGGSGDADGSSDEEEAGFKTPGLEQKITLVGDVRNRTVFLVDDMIDKAGSWIAAAETVVKRGGARRVYCMATHGIFGGNSLQQLEDCDCIDTIVVTNSFPIPPEKLHRSKKLVVLDLSSLLSEAIRRTHYGESISALFQHNSD